jgi:hypothetical protein
MIRTLREGLAGRVLEISDPSAMKDRDVIDHGPAVATTFENAVTGRALRIAQ